MHIVHLYIYIPFIYLFCTFSCQRHWEIKHCPWVPAFALAFSLAFFASLRGFPAVFA